MITRLLLLAVCLGITAFGQDYQLRYAVNKSAAAAVATIQQPATGAYRFNFSEVTISLNVGTTVTIERDCTTPASATAQALQPVNPRHATAVAKTLAYVDSNAASCTVLYGPLDIPGGVPTTIELKKNFLAGSGATNNLTIRTGTITAVGSINIGGTEVRP
jgi:hypothetical protein